MALGVMKLGGKGRGSLVFFYTLSIRFFVGIGCFWLRFAFCLVFGPYAQKGGKVFICFTSSGLVCG